MLGNWKCTKTKNNKIQCWYMELDSFFFNVNYRPGIENVIADALSRTFCAAATFDIRELHKIDVILALVDLLIFYVLRLKKLIKL